MSHTEPRAAHCDSINGVHLSEYHLSVNTFCHRSGLRLRKGGYHMKPAKSRTSQNGTAKKSFLQSQQSEDGGQLSAQQEAALSYRILIFPCSKWYIA